MPRPHKGYYIDGQRIPGVTTITGRFKDSGALVAWANRIGLEGQSMEDVRDEAATAGTLAHAMVEAHLYGQDPETALEGADPETAATARSAFGAYQSWESLTNLRIVAQETTLVSETYRYGGTPDAIAWVNGELALVDWKTSNSIYPEMLAQLAAYKQLWEENHPDMPLTGGFHLCRFAKEHGDFSHHYFPDLSTGWEAFRKMRELYEDMKELKKRSK
jgi:hypothetical protein